MMPTRIIHPASACLGIWRIFGYPADRQGTILTRDYVFCGLCRTPSTYRPGNLDDMYSHVQRVHPEKYEKEFADIENRPKRNHTLSTVAEREDDDEADKNADADQQHRQNGSNGVDYTEDEEYVDEDVDSPSQNVSEAETEINIDYLEPVGVDNDERVANNTMPSKRAAPADKHSAKKMKTKHTANDEVASGNSPVNRRTGILTARRLAQTCADDLLRPEQLLASDSSVRRLLAELADDEIPNVEEVRRELLVMHADMFTTYQQPAMSAPSFALTIERWFNVEQREFFTLSATYGSPHQQRMLCTWTPTAVGAVAAPWRRSLATLDMSHCRAVVVNFDCDHRTEANLPVFVSNGQLPIVPCMAYAIESAVQGVVAPLIVDDEMPRRAQNCLAHPDGYWQTILADVNVEHGAVAELLMPLKIALETLHLEQGRASASLSRPLAQQLLENHFDEDGDTTHPPQNDRKQVVRQILQKMISSDPFLSVLSFLDPRFHNLSDDADLPAIRTAIRAMCPKTANSIEPVTHTAQANIDGQKPSTKAGLSFFFATKKPSASAASRTRLPPIDVELQQYEAADALPFDQNPHDWWRQQADKYPLLSECAERLWCVPALVVPPATLLERRYMLRSTDDVDALLALHEMRKCGEGDG